MSTVGPAIELRAARRSDYGAVCALVKTPAERFLAFPALADGPTAADLLRLETTRSDLSVLTCNAEIAGFANLYDLRAGHSAFIGNLFIESRLRGRGLGSRLLDYMLGRVFDSHSIPQARLSVFAHNLPACRLYQRSGFECFAWEKRRNRHGQPVILLHLKLDRGRFRDTGQASV